MKVRFLRGFRRPLERIKRGHSLIPLRGEAGKPARRVLYVLAGIVVLVVLLRSLRAEPVLMNSAEIATVWDTGVLRVGVRTDVPGLAAENEGLEVELAQLLAEKIMQASADWPGGEAVELVPVNAMNVAAKLTDGSIDAAIALMPANAFSGYAYSRAYYGDPVLLLTRPGEENIPVKNIVLGCIQSASTTSLYVPSGAAFSTLSAYIENHPDDGLTLEAVVRYASYDALLSGLAQGEIDAAVLPGILASKYAQTYSFGVSPVTLGTLEYAVACLAEVPAIASVADVMLSDMEQDGSLDALKQKYGLD